MSIPLVGSSKIMISALRASHFCQDDFLLIPAGKLHHELFTVGDSYPQSLDITVEFFAFSCVTDKGTAAEQVQVRQTEVFAGRMNQYQTLLLAVLGE